MSVILWTLSVRIITSDSYKATKETLLHGELKSILSYNYGKKNSTYKPLGIEP